MKGKDNVFKNLENYKYFRTFSFNWLNYIGGRDEEVYLIFNKLTGLGRSVFNKIEEL